MEANGDVVTWGYDWGTRLISEIHTGSSAYSLLKIFKNFKINRYQMRPLACAKPREVAWSQYIGKSVWLFTFAEFPEHTAQARLQECEKLIAQVCSLLECSLSAQPARIVLFAEEKSCRTWLGLSCAIRGYTCNGWIYTWEGDALTVSERQGIMVHEMSHLCSTQLIARQPITVLEERFMVCLSMTWKPSGASCWIKNR